MMVSVAVGACRAVDNPIAHSRHYHRKALAGQTLASVKPVCDTRAPIILVHD